MTNLQEISLNELALVEGGLSKETCDKLSTFFAGLALGLAVAALCV
jgi:hypothetical protein